MLLLWKRSSISHHCPWQAGDNYFIELKNYEKCIQSAEWGWMSNNTVVIDEPGYDYADAARRIADNGEPGFLFLNTMQQYGGLKDAPDNKDWRVLGTNPCAEISLESRELCNLVEIHLNRHDSIEDYLRTIKFAYLYAKSITLSYLHTGLKLMLLSRETAVSSVNDWNRWVR